MKVPRVHVFPDGFAVESKKLLITRSKVLYERTFEESFSCISGDPATLKCPISRTGTLNFREIFRDPRPDIQLNYHYPHYEIAQEESSVPPLQRLQVKLEFSTDPIDGSIAQLKVTLVGQNKTQHPSQPLQHDVAMRLQYQSQEIGSGAGTLKSLPFDEVRQSEENHIEAILRLKSLNELDTVYRIMSENQHKCTIVLHCEADLSFRNLNQIYVDRPLPWVKVKEKPKFVDLKLEVLPTARVNLREAIQRAPKNFNYDALLQRLREKPPHRITLFKVLGTQPAEPMRPSHPSLIFAHSVGSPVPRTLAVAKSGKIPRKFLDNNLIFYTGMTSVPLKLPTEELISYTQFSLLRSRLQDFPLNLSKRSEYFLPARFFQKADGTVAYVKVRASHEQVIPFCFPPVIYPYVYPSQYNPQGQVALVRYQVSPDQSIYQDTTQPSLFYYLPDEFRLTREDSPPYRPALQVAFYTISAQSDVSSDADGQTAYQVEFTFKAVPFLRHDRQQIALTYIESNNLVPGGATASLAPLVPESAQLYLTLPQEAGGSAMEERADAEIVFSHYLVDSLALSANAFAELFNSMRVGGETFNGIVRVKLPGRADTLDIPFLGRLSKMLGPCLEQYLIERADEVGEIYRIAITNAIESPLELAEAVFLLMTDPLNPQWTPATPAPGALPLRLLPGERREIEVHPITPLPQAWAVILNPIQLRVNLDFEAMWLSVLETPGWDDITHQVTVEAGAQYFQGNDALEKVIIDFNHSEAIVELNKDTLTDSAELTKPILPYLLRQEEANDYFYRVYSWRQGQLVAQSNILEDDSPILHLVPPMG